MSRATSSSRAEFTEILEALQRSFDDPAAATPRISDFQLREILDGLPETGEDHTYVPSQILGKIYADAHNPRPPAPEPPKTEEEIVADALKLAPELSIDDLLRIRREYALENHPDRVAPELREQATRRMTIANMLIDQAVRERRSKASPARS